MYGDWKTYSTFYKAYEERERRPVLLISNVPYKNVDIFFDTLDELKQILRTIEEYMSITNDNIEQYYNQRHMYKDIIMIVDEAHKFFDSRHFWNKDWGMDRLTGVLTQCRKRNIKFYMVSQKANTIDLRIRTQSDYLEEYSHTKLVFPFLTIERARRQVYENRGDISDLQGQKMAIAWDFSWQQAIKDKYRILSEFYYPLTSILKYFVRNAKPYIDLWKEKFLTLYVVGLSGTKYNSKKNYSIWHFMNIIKAHDSHNTSIKEKTIPTVISSEDEQQKKTPFLDKTPVAVFAPGAGSTQAQKSKNTAFLEVLKKVKHDNF